MYILYIICIYHHHGRTDSTDFPDSIFPSVFTIYFSRQIFQITSRVHIEMM